jgi:hypothetical protein
MSNDFSCMNHAPAKARSVQNPQETCGAASATPIHYPRCSHLGAPLARLVRRSPVPVGTQGRSVGRQRFKCALPSSFPVHYRGRAGRY